LPAAFVPWREKVRADPGFFSAGPPRPGWAAPQDPASSRADNSVLPVARELSGCSLSAAWRPAHGGSANSTTSAGASAPVGRVGPGRPAPFHRAPIVLVAA